MMPNEHETERVYSVLCSLAPTLYSGDYDTWVRVISGVSNTYGAEKAYQLLTSAGFSDKKAGETLYKCNHPLSNVRIGTVFYIAKQFGIVPPPLSRNTFREQRYARLLETVHNTVAKSPPPITHFDYDSGFLEPIYKFPSDEIEEHCYMIAGDMDIDLSISVEYVAERYKTAIPRLFRVAINSFIKDKEENPKLITEGFKNKILTAKEIRNAVLKGYAILPSQMREVHPDQIYRNESQWLGSEIVGLDIDGTLTIQEALSLPLSQAVLLWYTTPRHTEHEHRFRLFFALHGLDTNKERYRKTVEGFMNYYRSDKHCKDAARFFYGSSKGVCEVIAPPMVVGAEMESAA